MTNNILVIHPADPSTDFLKEIYKDITCTVINYNCSKSGLRQAIDDHDRIIMMGHGGPQGLFGFGRVFVDSTLVYLLREKTNNVHIWCNADRFVETYKLKGFTTGMIISEYLEAVMYSLHKCTYEEINESNKKFAEVIKSKIHLEPKLMCEGVKQEYNSDKNPIIRFNNKNIHNF